MAITPDEDRSPAPAVTRAAAVLRHLAAQGPSALTDISRSLDLAKSSTLNLLVALEAAELVRRDGTSYALGPATVELGGAYVRGFDMVREFRQACDASPVLAPHLMHLAVLQGTDVLYLARHDGEHPWKLSALVGDRFPASITAVGNALLGGLSEERVRELYPDDAALPVWTEHSVTTVAALLAKLARARQQGWAVDERETNAGVVGLAVLVPARRPGDSPVALGVSLRAHEATVPVRRSILGALEDARARLCVPRTLSFPSD